MHVCHHGVVDSYSLLLNPFLLLVLCFLPAPAKTCHVHVCRSCIVVLPPPRSCPLSLLCPPISLHSSLLALSPSLRPLPAGTRKAYLTQNGQQSNGTTFERSESGQGRELSTFFLREEKQGLIPCNTDPFLHPSPIHMEKMPPLQKGGRRAGRATRHGKHQR